MTILEQMKNAIGKKIRVTTKDGEKVEGTGWYVEDHIDNPKDEYALIIVCAPREYDGFNESEIKTIEVL